MSIKNHCLNLTALFIVSLFISLSSSSLIFKQLELIGLDFFLNNREQIEIIDKIIIIEIDEQSLDYYGAWPWSREILAVFIEALNQKNAELIMLDIFMSEETPLTDYFLIHSMQKKSNVSLPVVFDSSPQKKLFNPQNDSYDNEQLSHFTFFEPFSSKSFEFKPFNVFSKHMIQPHQKIYENAYALGHGHAIPDVDGKVRRVPLFINHSKWSIPQFTFSVMLKYLGYELHDLTYKNNSLIVKKNNQEIFKIPVNQHGECLINWASSWKKGFKHISFIDIMKDQERIRKGLEPLIPEGYFKNSICLVGLTAMGLIDIKPTPIDNNYPMLGLHANLLNSILNQNFIKEITPLLQKIIIFIYPLIFLVPFHNLKKRKYLYLFILAFFLWPLIVFSFFKFFGFIFPLFMPLINMFLCVFLLITLNYIHQLYESKKLLHQSNTEEWTDLYTHRYLKFKLQEIFLPKNVVKNTLSLLLFDIDNFKKINDTYGHENGNIILKCLGKILKETSHKKDAVNFRYGGEEFCILLSQMGKSEAIQYAEILMDKIRAFEFKLSHQTIHVTVSLGIASIPDIICDTPEQLLQAADSAMYKAKTTGKDKVVFFHHNFFMYQKKTSKKTFNEIDEKISSEDSSFDLISLDLKKRNEEMKTVIQKMSKMQNEKLKVPLSKIQENINVLEHISEGDQVKSSLIKKIQDQIIEINSMI